MTRTCASEPSIQPTLKYFVKKMQKIYKHGGGGNGGPRAEDSEGRVIKQPATPREKLQRLRS